MANWYLFTTTAGADPLNPSNYTLYGANKPPCPGTCKICAIFAQDDGFGHPVITPAIQKDMVRALQFCTDQTTVALRS